MMRRKQTMTLEVEVVARYIVEYESEEQRDKLMEQAAQDVYDTLEDYSEADFISEPTVEEI